MTAAPDGPVRAFCMAGRHAVDAPHDATMLPPGWRLVRASVTPNHEWYADETSGAAILCCPEHPLGVDALA